MKDLSTEEKYKHHDTLKSYIDGVINKYIVPYKDRVTLAEVGYGVPVEDAYIYFDYPYDDSVEEFNSQLRDNKHLQGVDVAMHELFYGLQIKGSNGYIHYRYNYDKSKKRYNLFTAQNNIGLPEDHDLAKKFLAIMHCAVTNEKTYKDKVIITDLRPKFKQLVVLSRRLDQNAGSLIGKNTLVCAFTITDEKMCVDQVFIDSLYETVVPLLESYFNSPVLEKMLRERRKSEVLAYHHSIDNLELDSFVEELEVKLNQSNNLDFENTFKEFRKRFNVLRFLHYSLFETEYIYSNRKSREKHKRLFPFVNKTVCEIITILIDEFNKDELINHFSRDKNVSKVDFIPSIGDSDTPNPELYDILMILWNIWQNASAVAIGQSAREIAISAKVANGRLCIAFTNAGKMEGAYMDYINGIRSDYPSGEKYNSNPNKKYRGLEIIKDKCDSNNRKWILKGEVIKKKDKWFTTISVHF